MFDSKSDYALNKKDQEAIVCPSATGVHIRLTREDFTSEEEFLRWKAWSDGDYKGIESAGRSYYDNCIPLTEDLKSTGTSAEDAFFSTLLEAEHIEQKIALLHQIKDVLTETQYHRLWLYYVRSMTVEKLLRLSISPTRTFPKASGLRGKRSKNFSGSAKTGCKTGPFIVIGEGHKFCLSLSCT